MGQVFPNSISTCTPDLIIFAATAVVSFLLIWLYLSAAVVYDKGTLKNNKHFLKLEVYILSKECNELSGFIYTTLLYYAYL